MGTLGATIALARSAPLRASFAAAWVAFRDPSRIAERVEPSCAPPPPIERSSLARGASHDPLTDGEIARELGRFGGDDSDDPDGPAVESLAKPDLRVPITRRTVRYVQFLTRSDAGRATFLERFRRAGSYRPMMERALRDAGLPEDLVWVAAVESSFDPRAVSAAGAAGLWQLLPSTARHYGLSISPWLDERRSPERATKAAVTMLRDLYERFGRWDLALAAYNLGHDGLLRAMDRAAAQRGVRAGPVDLAELAESGAIPEETANYVPKVVAFSLVALNRARYHLEDADAEPLRPLTPAELVVPASTRIATIARAAEVPVAVIREYNPELLRDRTPPTGGDVTVSVPAHRVARALAAFPALHAAEERADAERTQRDAEETGVAAPSRDDELEVAALSDDRLPPRPSYLGHNRLPEFALPRRAPLPVAGLGLLDAQLPERTIGGGVGWRALLIDQGGGGFLGDPDAWARMATSGAGSAPAGHELERAIASSLRSPSSVASGILTDDGGGERLVLPNGITVVLRRDPRAVDVAIALRLDRTAPSGPAEAAEAHTVVAVAPPDLDVGVQVAAARARMLLAEGGGAYQADLRRRASEGARKALASRPYGAAWLALSSALFPQGHPLEGTLVGVTEEEPAVLRDALLLEALRQGRTPRRLTVTLAGQLDLPKARALVEPHFGWILAPADAPVEKPAAGQRVVVEEPVLTPAALFGWLVPADGDPDHAALRVALDALCRGPSPRLEQALVHHARVARSVKCTVDPGPRAGVAAIEVVAAPAVEIAALERELRAALDELRAKGLSGGDVAVARVLLKKRLERRLAERMAPAKKGAPPEVTTARLRAVLAPGTAERLLAEVDHVTPADVDKALAKALDPSRAVVVTTVRKLPSGTAAAEASAARLDQAGEVRVQAADLARESAGLDAERRVPLGVVSTGEALP